MPLAALALDNQNFLRVLEVFAVGLIWLFFLWIMRSVWAEIRPPKHLRYDGDGARFASESGPVSRSHKPGKLKLQVIEPDTLAGRIFEVPDEITVGRAAGCGVPVTDSYTSNLHARLYRRDNHLWAEDLGSTNGTYVNAERISSPVRLGKGDLVQVGGTVFEVVR